jgi:hypothetical protein
MIKKHLKKYMKTEKLPQGFKKKLVSALKSGKYKQYSGGLKSFKEASYCCLGVACVVAGHRPSYDHGYIIDNNYPKVPNILRGDWSCTIPGQLASLNDAEVPFEVIAGCIDQWL